MCLCHLTQGINIPTLLSSLSSQPSLKAVRMGSSLDSAMSDGEARALYILSRDRECRRLSTFKSREINKRQESEYIDLTAGLN